MSDKTSIPCHENPELKFKQRYIFNLYVLCAAILFFFFNLQTFGIPQGVFRFVVVYLLLCFVAIIVQNFLLRLLQ